MQKKALPDGQGGYCDKEESAEHKPETDGEEKDLCADKADFPENMVFRSCQASGRSGSPLQTVKAAAVKVAAQLPFLASAAFFAFC